MAPETAGSADQDRIPTTAATEKAAYRTVGIDPLDHCPTHAVCPPCREGWGHWDGHQYVPTLESEARP